LANRVFLHIGLPKTGTTYLQSVLWSNAEELRRQGVLLPGGSARQHMQATVVVRERGLRKRAPAAARSWDELVHEVREWPGTALISHEFFGAATAEQAAHCIADLGGSAVSVIITARDLLSVVTSYWQEYVKHGRDARLDEFPVGAGSGNEWSWDTVDIGSVLRRWNAAVPSERIQVLVLPDQSAPPETLLRDFCGLIGVDPERLSTERARSYLSLGVVEAELMRRVGPRLPTFANARDRGVWLRSYLAMGILVPRGGERFLPSPERIAELRDRAAAGVDVIRECGVEVIGDLDRLLVPVGLPGRRHPDSVTDAELLESAVVTIADLLTDVRRLREENTALREAAASPSVRPEQVPGQPSRPRGSVLRRRMPRK
jgi:hypothetical protein